MNTAMQQVLSLVEQMYKDAKSIMVESAMNDVINIITQEGLPKEKEQIIDFANSFYDDCVTEGGSLQQSAEEYYNQTYNQSK
jgi:hypothetical protein